MPRRRSRRLFSSGRRRSSSDSSGLLLLLPLLLVMAYPRVALVVVVLLFVAGGLVWWVRQRNRWRDRQALLQLDLAGVDRLDPLSFEAFVAELLTAQGYRTQLTKASHDIGVDVVAVRGSERIAVQVKHYAKQAISGKAIGEALLGMPHYDCNACMVVTNSRFTSAAIKAASPHPCTLVDRQELARWLGAFRAWPTGEHPEPVGGYHLKAGQRLQQFADLPIAEWRLQLVSGHRPQLDQHLGVPRQPPWPIGVNQVDRRQRS